MVLGKVSRPEKYTFLKNERIIHHVTINEDRKRAKTSLPSLLLDCSTTYQQYFSTKLIPARKKKNNDDQPRRNFLKTASVAGTEKTIATEIRIFPREIVQHPTNRYNRVIYIGKYFVRLSTVYSHRTNTGHFRRPSYKTSMLPWTHTWCAFADQMRSITYRRVGTSFILETRILDMCTSTSYEVIRGKTNARVLPLSNQNYPYDRHFAYRPYRRGSSHLHTSNRYSRMDKDLHLSSFSKKLQNFYVFLSSTARNRVQKLRHEKRFSFALISLNFPTEAYNFAKLS